MRNFPNLSCMNRIYGIKVNKKWKYIFNKYYMYIRLNIVDNVENDWTYVPLTHPLKVVIIAIPIRVDLHNFECRMRNFQQDLHIYSIEYC